MVEFSHLWPTNGVGDGLIGGYPSAQLIQMTAGMWTIGPDRDAVGRAWNNSLELTNPAGLNLSMDTGGGVVSGFEYDSTAAVVIPLVLPIINTTGWRWVLRADWAAQTVRAALLQSADGVAAIPAVTQINGVTWEVSLAFGTITVGGVITITDDRSYLRPAILIDNVHLENRTIEFLVPAVDAVTGGASVARTTVQGWTCAPAVRTDCYGAFKLPSDVDLTAAILVTTLFSVAAAAANNIHINNSASFGTVGENYNVHVVALLAVVQAAPAANVITAPGGIQLDLQPLGAVSDWVSMEFFRDGAAGADTYAGDLFFMGWRVQYTRDH